MNEIDDTEATARYLKKPLRTLEQWRYVGAGPRYVKVGSAVRYRKADVDKWLAENTVEPAQASA